MDKKIKINVYTDGGCSLKNEVAGWGAIIDYPDKERISLSGSFDLRITNNQMELWAVLEALQHILHNVDNTDKYEIVVHSDSEYVVLGATKWLPNWKRKNWKSTTGAVKNKPLWEALDAHLNTMNVTFKWVRGHNGHTENELVDKLAVSAYEKLIDEKNS